MNISFSLYDYFGFFAGNLLPVSGVGNVVCHGFESLLKSLNVLQNINQFIFIIHLTMKKITILEMKSIFIETWE